MAIRQRAIRPEDKQERHHAILDAAERLLLRSPERVASMADVAAEAGLAKGTVYLYFASKEELLLALHERNIDGFFEALVALLAGDAVTIDAITTVTRSHIIAEPLFLPLASRCFGIMDRQVPAAAVPAFTHRLADRLERAGARLERHFDELTPGDGMALLRHSYALIIGLSQLPVSTSELRSNAAVAPASAVLARSYPDELERALRALWEGTLARAPGRGAAR